MAKQVKTNTIVTEANEMFPGAKIDQIESIVKEYIYSFRSCEFLTAQQREELYRSSWGAFEKLSRTLRSIDKRIEAQRKRILKEARKAERSELSEQKKAEKKARLLKKKAELEAKLAELED